MLLSQIAMVNASIWKPITIIAGHADRFAMWQEVTGVPPGNVAVLVSTPERLIVLAKTVNIRRQNSAFYNLHNEAKLNHR